MKFERETTDGGVGGGSIVLVKVREDLEGLIGKNENGGRNRAGAEYLNVVIHWEVKKDFNVLI